MGLSRNARNAKFPHVYVVLRIDDHRNAKVEDNVSAVATYTDEAAAAAEADRLNGLKTDSGSHYVVLISRLKG